MWTRHWGPGARNLGPGSDRPRPDRPLPQGSPPARGARFPFSRGTRLPSAPGRARQRDSPARCARRCPAPATVAAGARPGRRRCRRLSTRPPAAARYPGSGAAVPRNQARAPPPPRTPCHRPGAASSPAPAPYPGSSRRGGPARTAAQEAAAGRAGCSAAEGSSAEPEPEPEPRGAAPTMAELRSRAPRPPRPSGGG